MRHSPSDALLACTTCGGALPLDVEICRYCNSRYDSDLAKLRHTPKSVPAAERFCPRCEIALTTLDIQLNGAFHVERCGTCHGLFLDHNELALLLKSAADEALAVDEARLKFLEGESKWEKVNYVKCAVCKSMMQRKNYGSRSGVIVDICQVHGVWLDAGELGKLLKWARLGGQSVRCPLDKQREQIKKEREEWEQQKRLRNRYNDIGEG